ncbi:MAG: hypothetical protein Ct9H300mP11_15680 [Chloroflexota bacterium]|nr:MAG: hypothetical protein Ct9H300mP11_15680 [Chloroflexota bacterium]
MKLPGLLHPTTSKSHSKSGNAHSINAKMACCTFGCYHHSTHIPQGLGLWQKVRKPCAGSEKETQEVCSCRLLSGLLLAGA